MSDPNLVRKLKELQAAREESIAAAAQYNTPWHAASAAHYHALILAQLRIPATAAVLEIGCGVGNFQRILAARFSTVYGLDVSPESLALAEPGTADVLRLVAADAEHIPFRDGGFDAVIVQGSLHHIPDLDRALVEIRRVLAPGGLFVLAEPVAEHALIRWGRGRLSKRKERYFTESELLSYLLRGGFRPLARQRTGYVAFAVGYLLRGELARLRRPRWLWSGLSRTLLFVDQVFAAAPKLRNLNSGLVQSSRRLA